MIVPMKKLTVLCLAADNTQTLEKLRDLGCVHLDLSGAHAQDVMAARTTLSETEAAIRLVEKEARAQDAQESTTHVALSAAEILEAAAARDKAAEDVIELGKTVRLYERFGDFDLALVQKLAEAGVRLVLRADGSFDFYYGDEGAQDAVGEILPLPTERLADTISRLAKAQETVKMLSVRLASADVEVLKKSCPGLEDRVQFAAAAEKMMNDGALFHITGWLPEDALENVRQMAFKMGWGLLVEDSTAEDVPPTYIRPPRFFKSVTALFAGLGIAPAYTEADVSVPFMCYFALFFAMLVGDGAYGAIFLLATLWGWRKTAQARTSAIRSWLILLTVFSVATIAWGLLSNTWFGAGLPFAKDWPTVVWLSDPSYNNMMLLCFTIGVSHLMLARIWSGVCMLNDRRSLAQFGWAGILLFMYLVTNAIVGIFAAVPTWAFWMFGISLALVFLFTLKGNELKTRGIELGMLPLNIMSALGDIISYVRLFAVGLASVKVAENFNSMALGLVNGANPWWMNALMVLALVFILAVGHGLNLAMAGLSILVHAVRLNTLEFSNHKGVSWSGYAFAPFQSKAKA